MFDYRFSIVLVTCRLRHRGLGNTSQKASDWRPLIYLTYGKKVWVSRVTRRTMLTRPIFRRDGTTYCQWSSWTHGTDGVVTHRSREQRAADREAKKKMIS
jgi:hypothetical protein